MYQKPKTAKRLYFDVIPKAVDEYHQQLRAFAGQDTAARLANPVWHIHRGQPPASDMVVSFAMLLNLASAANAHDKAVLWGFIRKYAPGASPATHPGLDAAAGGAVRYFEDFVKPAKRYRAPDAHEARGARRPARPARRMGRAGRGGGAAEPGLRRRQRARVRAAARLVRRDLRGAARRDPGAALRRLHRGLRHPRDDRADRGRARRPAGGGRAGLRLRRGDEDGFDGARGCTPEPATARHCLAPVRRPERASAEARGGCRRDRRAGNPRAPAWRSAESRLPEGRQARADLSTDKSAK